MKTISTFLLMVISLSIFSQGNQSSALDDSLINTANSRIEKYRKAPVVLIILDSIGNPLPAAIVRVEQTRHSFLFGCNIFPLYRYKNEKHQEYARQFSSLFNYATLPFYWGTYERVKGETEEARKYNEAVADWCKAYNIETKGHTLIWHEVYPKWAPRDVDSTKRLLEARINNIIQNFKNRVEIWDVVNEATVAQKFKSGVSNWVIKDGADKMVETAFAWAHRANPNAKLVYNDWNFDENHYRLIDRLVKDNTPFDIIGLQSHMHQKEWTLKEAWDKCERYSAFGKELHFTELTVVSGEHGWLRPLPWPTTSEGEKRQAEYVEKVYTLLFSHPAVQAITWWDFQDGSWQGAPSGLLRSDLTPKPAYERLLKLIRQTWWTRESLISDSKGMCNFSGFLGDYDIYVQAGGKSIKVLQTLSKGNNNWKIKL